MKERKVGKLTKDDLVKLIDRRGRHGDGGGLYFRAIGERKAYWVYRYRAAGKEREISIGPYPEISLAEARIKHAALRKIVVVDKGDPVAEKRAAKSAVDASAPKPTFGECADHHIAAHAASWRSLKSAQAWRMTLTTYCAPIRGLPVDKVDNEAVLACLKPVWSRAPETASRLRGRIEAVLASAQVDGHIHQDRTNPARWKGWLDRKLPNPKKIGDRGHHAAMPYADLPEFMATLRSAPGVAAKALAFIVLTAARSGEALRMTWDEADLSGATWTIPASRMKARKAHAVPLSDQAMAILRGQMATRGKNPHVFPSHLPRQALSNTSLAVVMRRLGANATVHGFRSSSRSWMADTGVAFEVAEACLAHTVGSAVVQAYQRSSMLERRRPVLQAWADHVCGDTAEAADNVVPLRPAG
jgi:integrase